ncbi:MAG: GHKL domain-containing protein [Candidatus Dadabacteria bacterium]|nr:GHKL domain-containing protein [Candidatus Dadabacteria bacterium]NIQ15843.1 GHKL domain-containing protein [Candidatus Dadabacteria bacterium]
MRLFKNHFLFIVVLSTLILTLNSFISINNDKTRFFISTVTLLLFSFLICNVIEKTLSNNFNKIVNFLKRISNKELDTQKLDTSISELNPKLYLYLKEFSEKLSSNFTYIENERNQFKTILEAMNEGVIIISEKGNTLLINNSAKQMLQIDKIKENQAYWEIIRNIELLDIIESSQKSDKSIKEEISTVYPEEKFYSINVELIEKPSKVIIVVIFDITEFKKLEKIKADLIANVSHELRTPLTSMKGYLETLIDEAYENKTEMDNFLKTIYRNTDRLINIVSDLLILSELEEKQPQYGKDIKSDYEEINIKEAILHSILALNSKISEKNINEKLDIQTNIPDIKGDKFLIEQMLTNLIDNAVKYTPENGFITVKANKQNDNLILEISDTGIGIPKEHHDRIFERFYRVDKDRSREIGGTGLGLSIVKHIVLQHGGTIKLESEENVGTKFIIQLPYT